MQVYNNSQILQSMSYTNFKGFKSAPKCVGLYEKYPEYGKQLIDTFKNNSKAIEFCKKYNNVELFFLACKDSMSGVESYIRILFDNPAKSKFLGLFGSIRDEISLSAYGNAYNIEDSLKDSTNRLVDEIIESTAGKSVSGILNQHLKLKEDEIQEALAQKSDKIKEKKENENKALTLKEQKKSSQKKLDASIQELMDSVK
ncbi:hypothetical protein IJ384_04745 [bacterium]|nr:hypothetical protein [bacterium]